MQGTRSATGFRRFPRRAPFPDYWTAGGRPEARNSAGWRREARSCEGRNRSPGARWPPRCRRRGPAIRRRAVCSSGRCRALPGARRSAVRGPSPAIVSSAISSCARQSQRRLWNTSPVRHWEWMRTSGGRARADVAHGQRHGFFAAASDATLKPVDAKAAELRRKIGFGDLFEPRRGGIIHVAGCCADLVMLLL